MYLLCIYKKLIILSLLEIDTLNFTMYTLKILTCPLKIYVNRLHNLISINVFFTTKYHFMVLKKIFFIIVKRKPKTNKLKKLLKTQTFLNPIAVNIFFTIKDDSFPLYL